MKEEYHILLRNFILKMFLFVELLNWAFNYPVRLTYIMFILFDKMQLILSHQCWDTGTNMWVLVIEQVH